MQRNPRNAQLLTESLGHLRLIDDPELDEDLAEFAAALLLCGEGEIELVSSNESSLDEELADSQSSHKVHVTRQTPRR
jgi:hypothetical protein